MMLESENPKIGEHKVCVIWRAPNPSDTEDDGTQLGGWIRDQMRANIEIDMGGALFPVYNMRKQDREGD